MLPKQLTTADLEAVYDRIATAIDAVGDEKTALFLAKLTLALANLVGDRTAIDQAIDGAMRDL